MAYNISALKSDLQGVMHGTTTNQITGLNNVINRAARQLLLDIDPQETKRTVEFINPIFNTVFDYPVADDLKGNALIDIFPQVNRIPRDIWSQAYNQAFDLAKQSIYTMANMFTLNFNSGIKTLKINAPFLNPPVYINQAESITANGTWTATVATNLTVDNTNYVTGAGSLKFDTTTTCYLENSTMTAVDLSAYLNQSSLFVWVYLPTASNFSSVTLRWGSDSSNYYYSTQTTNQQGTAFVNGWNLIQCDWKTATKVGTPVTTAINYLRVTLTASAGNTGVNNGCHINGIQSILGTVLSYEYYSKYMFRDASTLAFQETVTDDSNLINLDTETYNLLFNLTAYFALQQQQGLDAQFFDAGFFKTAYDMGVAKYKSLYKSERQKPQSTYYRQPDTSNRRYLGRRYNY